MFKTFHSYIISNTVENKSMKQQKMHIYFSKFMQFKNKQKNNNNK